MDRRHRAWVWMGIGLALAALTGLLYAFDPSGARFYPPCPFHALTDLHCPGCGTLRAIHQLAHGDLGGALRLNPLAVAMLPFVLYGLVSEARENVTGRGLSVPRIPPRWTWVLAAGVVVFWMLRNIPVHPFTLLAPH